MIKLKAKTNKGIQFSDLFDLNEILNIQDLFSDATGVASIITHPDGTPITKPSNFCRLCRDIIRNTALGLNNCFRSDAEIGRVNFEGLVIQQCLSGGLWDAGASIVVGGEHIANWLIGQIKNSEVDKNQMLKYAEEIGADKKDFAEALDEVPEMSKEKFTKVAQMLFAVVSQLSSKAYQNSQLQQLLVERQLAEEALKVSEEKFRLLFINAPLGYQSLNNDGCLLDINQAWLDTLGYKRNEVIGKWFGDFLTSGYQDGFRKRFPLFKAIGSIHSEFEMIHKDGKIIFIAFDGKIGYDSKGHFDQIHCILKDITEQRRIESALHENEEIFQQFMEHSPIYVFFKDAAIRSLRLSKNYEQMLGKPLTELLGKTMDDLFPSDFAKKIISDDKQILSNGKVEVLEEQLNGRHYTTIKFPIVLDGKPKYLAGYTIDISEQKRQEEALKASYAKYQAVFESTGSATLLVEADYTISLANHECFRLTGYSQDELIGQKWTKFVDNESLEKMIMNHKLRRQNPSMAPKKYDVKLINKSGEIRYAMLDIGVVKETGQSIVSILDITDRITAEKALLNKADELERFYRLMLGRELKMVALKKEINDLLKKSGKNEKYKIHE